MPDHLSRWSDRIKNRIRQQMAFDGRYDDEVDRRLRVVMNMEVPTDAEMIAMQQRGELPSDRELEIEIR